MSKKSNQLRRVVDDAFVGGGHQIVKVRQRKRLIPSWANNNERVKEIILRSFPKLDSDAKQHATAARWVRIVQLYFRAHYTRAQVAEEMGLTSEQVKGVIRSMRRVSVGRRANGTGNLGGRPGRPKTRASQS